MGTALTPLRQTLIVRNWLPTMSANGSVGHWSTHQKKHDVDRDMAWACAKQAGWVFVPGRVKLTITLVYSKRPIPDPRSKCTGLIDGLTAHKAPTLAMLRAGSPLGFFEGDSTDYLDLVVRAVVEPGVRETRITLEPAD